MILYGEDSMRLNKSEDRSVQQHLETSKYSILVQFETRSRERITMLPNTVACNRPLRQATGCLHRESGMHEDEGWAFPQDTLDSKSPTVCTQSEFPNRSTRLTWTGCKNIWWPTKRIKEFLGDRKRHRGLQNSWYTSFYSWTAKYKSQRSKRLIENIENHPNKESFLQDFKQPKEINKFSEKSQELIADMNNTEVFELCETSSKQQCTDCNLYLEAGTVYCTCGRCLRISQST